MENKESGNSIPIQNVSRRGFIKGAATMGTVCAGASMFSVSDWLSPCEALANDADSGQEEKSFTYHCANCGSPACALECTTRDGKLVKVEPNQGWNDPRLATICLKGISEINRIYSEDRLQTPLKRVGERGEGKFVSITWDEAIATVGDSLKKAIEEHGSQSVCFYSSSSANTDDGIRWLPTLLGTPARRAHPAGGGIDCGIGNGYDDTTGNYAPVVPQSSDVRTWKDSDVMVLVGHNPSESRLHSVRYVQEAREAGSELIVIDPRFTTTAQHADWWIPIKPGTDPALITASIHHIIENGLYNEEFVLNHTAFPFLIDVEAGTYLRAASETKDEEGNAIKGDVNPFMVCDSVTGAIVPYNSGVVPELYKEVVVDGKTYKTVMQLAKETYKDATPEWAAEITEIPAEDIKKLAEKYATAGNAVLSYGMGGADKYPNSDITGHGMSLLVSLTGHIGRPGTGFGEGIVPLNHPAATGKWKLPEQFKTSKLPQSAATFTQEESPVKVLFGIGNPINQLFANSDATDKWVKSLDFVVCMNPYHCPSVDYADIVLPTTTGFESEYDVRGLQNRRDHAVLAEKVIEPLFDSHTDFEVERMLCEYLGYGEYIPKNPEELVNAMLTGAKAPWKGITVDTLKQNNGIQPLDVPKKPVVNYADLKFPTASGRLEVYHPSMAKYNQALPVHEDCAEITSEEIASKYPLQYGQVRSRNRVHSQFAGVHWIKDVNGEPAIRINPKDAEARNIKTGDTVRVYNDRGSVKFKALVAKDMRPGQISIQEGWWPSQTIEGNFQSLTNDKLIDRQRDRKYGPVIPFMDTKVEVEKA